MLFQQVKNHTQLSQSQKNRKTRQDFHKQIRKQALNKKISSMRKSLMNTQNINNQHDNRQEQFLSHFDQSYRNTLQQKQRTHQQEGDNHDIKKDKIILKSLSILSKFSKMKVEKNIGNIEIKRLMKKIDAIICLLMNIDGWIIEDQLRENIQGEMKKKRGIQIQEEGNVNVNVGINPFQWNQTQFNKQKPKQKMVLLRQLIMLVLFQKIFNYLQVIRQKATQTDNSIISYTLIKWLLFYQQIMKLFYLDMNLQLKYTLQQLGENYFIQTIKSYYFDIVQKVVELMGLEQLTQVFFNPIGDIQGLNSTGVNQNSLLLLGNNIQSLNSYITVSPFEYLIENEQNGYKFLIYLEEQMIAKIQQEEKSLCIERIKLMSLTTKYQQQNSQYHRQLQQLSNKQIQLQKSKAILNNLSKKLQHSKNRRQIKYRLQQQ